MPWNALVMAGILVMVMVGAFGWQQHVQQNLPSTTVMEPWQRIREDYPMPEPFKPAAELSEVSLKAMLHANPFSPQRQKVQETAGTGEAGSSGPPPPPPPPQFIFKGRVLMGKATRAVLEDITNKKTYFLQVGQEVAGFKVLDITETQVVLSKPNSQEPLTLSLTPKESSKESKKEKGE